MSASTPAALNELISKAAAALNRGDPATALALAQQAAAAAPTHPEPRFQAGLAYWMNGDAARALAEFDTALVADPYHLPAMLFRAQALERFGKDLAAVQSYRHALAMAPTAERLPPALRSMHAHGAAKVAAHNAELRDFLRERLAAQRAQHDPSALRRFDESLEIYSGLARAYSHQPTMLHYPALPATGFFDRALFPWIAELEEASDVIRAELADILSSSTADEFAPYVAYRPGAPVNQWNELNHSKLWSSWFLWKNGERQEAACARAPKTAAALDRLPLNHCPGFGPTALFSALAPRTRIPPHTGSTNVRSIVHLPLILPGPAWFRVGNERRSWRYGEAWAFDDSIEHEAMNESDGLRVILIFDVWNPNLSLAERSLVSAMLQAKNDFQTARGAAAQRYE